MRAARLATVGLVVALWAQEAALAADSQGAIQPLAIQLVDPALCFSQEALASEIRRQLPAVEIVSEVGAHGGAALAVRRRNHEREIDVEVRRESPTAPARSEHHAIPLGSECRVLVETVASIAVRAVVPLGYRPLSPAVPGVTQEPNVRVLPPIVVTVRDPNGPARDPAVPPHLQIDASARLNLSTEGIGPGAGGLFSLAYRARHFVLFAAGGVEQSIIFSSERASATLRRAPLMAGVGYEIEIPSGAIRLTIAGLLDLWSARLVDDTGTTNTHWENGGLAASLTYHYRPARRVDLFGGLDFEQALQTSKWTSHDGSVALTTPSSWFSPKIGAALNFF